MIVALLDNNVIIKSNYPRQLAMLVTWFSYLIFKTPPRIKLFPGKATSDERSSSFGLSQEHIRLRSIWQKDSLPNLEPDPHASACWLLPCLIQIGVIPVLPPAQLIPCLLCACPGSHRGAERARSCLLFILDRFSIFIHMQMSAWHHLVMSERWIPTFPRMGVGSSGYSCCNLLLSASARCRAPLVFNCK